MRLAPPLCRLVGLIVAVAVLLAPVAAQAQGAGDAAATRILSIGAGAAGGAGTAGLPEDVLVALDRLPVDGGIDEALYGAWLRANPVTTFPDTRPLPPRTVEELFLVVRAELGEGDTGARLTLGGEALTIPGFGERLATATAAFDARFRRAVFVEIADPGTVLPAALPGIRAALDPLGFDLQVLMISGRADPSAPPPAPVCAEAPAPVLSLARGLGDRVPFGDGDGATTLAEAESFLGDALRRAVARGCGPAYSLIVKGADAPGQVVVSKPLAPGEAVADRLRREGFEAMLLAGTENVAALSDYLDSCVYCPGEAALAARLEERAARARIAALEDAMWDEIKDDTGRERLAIYVDHCRLCLHSDAALTRIERLDAAAAAAERERRAFGAAAGARDLTGLRDYAETCVACAFADEAAALIAELEADGAYMAERALLAEALDVADRAALDAYLEGCTVCDGADAVRERLDRLAALEAARAPCLAAAGLPQAGGPRKLEDIDQAAAEAACGAAAEAFPEDGLLQVTLGRIAQARGEFDRALAAYEAGMRQGVPAAFGLAAYAAYAPAGGGPIDPARVEELALAGAELDDWLSREVLSVLYSKDLVPGKSGAEAFAAAMEIARDGNPLAQFFVGHYYLTGVGTEVSEEQAADWFTAALEGGYTHASSFLAGVYERGSGDRARPDAAAELYWSALGQGDAATTDRLTTDLAERSAEVVRIIQGKLREQGLYRGAVDGVPGPGTEAAIRAYANSLGSQG